MKNYLKLIFGLSILFWVANWYSTEYFDITTDTYIAWLKEININVKWIKNPSDVKLKIWDKDMKFKWAQWTMFSFTVPTDFKLNSSNIGTVVSINWTWYDLFNWPYLSSVNKSGTWEDLIINWTFTGSCNLKLNEWTSLEISKLKDWSYHASLPTDIKKTIESWYLICDWLWSNSIDLDLSAPEIFYLKSVDETTIEPEEKIIMIGKNFKITDDDTFSLIFDNKEIKDYEIKDSWTIYFTLPKENIKNKVVKVKINWKESNSLYIEALEYPKISNISYEYQDFQYVIKIDWEFDYTLGNISVYYWNNKLSVVKTWENFIYAAFPTITREKSSITWKDIPEKFSCNYYFTPNNIHVEIWSVSSNKFFTYLDIIPRIKSVQIPYCDSSSCYLSFYVDNLSKWRYVKIKYNWTEYPIYKNESDKKFTIDTDKLVKDWKIEIYTDQCLYSETFYFDYSRQLKPKIFKIEWNWFKAWGSFTIFWENFTDVMITNADKLSLSFSPDYLSKNENNVPILTKWQSEIKWTLSMSANAQTWQTISASVSNEIGQSNWVSFQTYSNKTEFLWNPEIYFVSFPDWFNSWDTAIIEWIWFSEKCNQNNIYFEDVKINPTKCSYKSLTVKIPNKESNEIKVERWWFTSNIYKLNFIFWWNWNFAEFNLSANNENLEKESQDDKNVEFSIKITNTLWNIYLDNLYLNFEWTNYVPFSNFKIQIWDDARRYIYRASSRELIKTDEEVIWYLKKIGENKYQIIFNNLYIPYAKEWITIKITANIDTNDYNTENIRFYLPEQKINYYLMYWEFKLHNKNIEETEIWNISLIWWEWNKCFAASWYEEYCSNNDNSEEEIEEEEETETETEAEEDIEILTGENLDTPTLNLIEEFNNKKYIKLAKKLNAELIEKIYNIFLKYNNSLEKKYWSNEILEKMNATNNKILFLANNLNEEKTLEIANNIYNYFYYTKLYKDWYNFTKKWDDYEEKYIKLANKMDNEYIWKMNQTMEKILWFYIDKISSDDKIKKLYELNNYMKLLEWDNTFKNYVFFAMKMYEFYNIYNQIKQNK